MYKSIYLGDELIHYELIRKNVKNINLRIRKDKGITVSAGYLVSEKTIENFLLLKSKFILNAINKYSKSTTTACDFNKDDVITILSKKIKISVIEDKSNVCKLIDDSLIFFVSDINNNANKKKIFSKWLSGKFYEHITEVCDRYYTLFAKYNIDKPSISVRLMKTRWGSCNYAKNKLNFNTRLFFTSNYCIEYVVVHEFAHLLVHNHSKEFYKVIEEFLPDYKNRVKELKNFESQGNFI